MTKSGLWIEGRHVRGPKIDADGALFKALVNLDQQLGRAGGPAGYDGGFVLQIAQAMIDDRVAHEFSKQKEFIENVRLRYYIVNVMRAIAGGLWDYNYFVPQFDAPPTLGLCNNAAEVVEDLSELENIDRSKPMSQFLGALDGLNKYWHHLFPYHINKSFMFRGVAKTAMLMVANTHPFRGECAGALQLTILHAAYLSLHEGLQQLWEDVGAPVYVGSWRVPPANLPQGTHGSPRTFATRFMGPNVLDQSDDRFYGVPGDYFYFRNIKNYGLYTHGTGAWAGENCIFLGKDFLGQPRFSGMGLSYETDYSMRMKLLNAAIADCNAGYIKALRDNEKPQVPFRPVKHPDREIKFVERRLIRIPGSGQEDDTSAPGSIAPTPANHPDDMQARLKGLGFTESEPGIYQADKVEIGAMAENLGLVPLSIQQAHGTGLNHTVYTTRVGDWMFSINPHDPEGNPGALDMTANVSTMKAQALDHPFPLIDRP